jgi:hypothetical protein
MTKRNRRTALPLLVCCLLALSVTSLVSAAAQEPPAEGKKPKPYALIFGTVFDSRQLSAYGIRVKIRPADKKKPVWEQVSNHSGEFAQRVPPGPGDYIVSAEVKGPKGSSTHEQKVHVFGDERVDVFLHLEEGEGPK